MPEPDRIAGGRASRRSDPPARSPPGPPQGWRRLLPPPSRAPSRRALRSGRPVRRSPQPLRRPPAISISIENGSPLFTSSVRISPASTLADVFEQLRDLRLQFELGRHGLGGARIVASRTSRRARRSATGRERVRRGQCAETRSARSRGQSSRRRRCARWREDRAWRPGGSSRDLRRVLYRVSMKESL